MKLLPFSTLQIALGASIAVHAALLTVRLVDPQAFDRVLQDNALEVILVNANTQEQPDKAQAIAQAALAGGGEEKSGRASSPLPPALLNTDGQDNEQDQERQMQEMEEQKHLLLQVKNLLASLPPEKPRQEALTPEQAQREQKQKQLVKVLAEIERRIKLENAKPKKRYISPATREAVYALYYDQLRRTIEDRGTQNFPQAKGQKLYGELTMVININRDGRVLSTEVVQSSGNPTLDRQARAIASSAGPFGKFTPAMRRKADEISVVSRFNFARDGTFDTRLSAK